MAAPLKQPPQLWARKTTKHAKAATASAALKAAKVAAMANAEKAVVTAAVVDAMAAVASAAKTPQAKSAHPAKVVVVVKAAARHVPKVATNCVKAKPAPHAANALSGVSAQNALQASAHRAKAAAMGVAKTAMKAETKAAAMQHLS